MQLSYGGSKKKNVTSAFRLVYAHLIFDVFNTGWMLFTGLFRWSSCKCFSTKTFWDGQPLIPQNCAPKDTNETWASRLFHVSILCTVQGHQGYDEPCLGDWVPNCSGMRGKEWRTSLKRVLLANFWKGSKTAQFWVKFPLAQVFIRIIR